MENDYVSLFDSPRGKLIIALDNVSNLEEVEILIKKLSPYAGWFKIGLETLTAFGSEKMTLLVQDSGAKIFYDGKWHDIPNTVGNTAGKSNSFNVDMVNIHCSNGMAAMKKLVEKKGGSIAIGVTVLTCHDDAECEHIFGLPVKEKVLMFARDAKEAGLNGIVCSPQELKMLAGYPELDSLIKITPGIQPAFMQSNDQKRVMTPGEAIRAGATAIVVGRAITEAADPVKAAEMILSEIAAVMQEMSNQSIH